MALKLGACAILYSDPAFDDSAALLAGSSSKSGKDVAFIRTANTRTAMAPAAAAFYDRPADKLETLGVTGTDGKTSTVYFIDQLLECCDRKSGFISTAACKRGNSIEKNPYRQSTPEAVEINMILDSMVAAGKTSAVIEATSHGLSPVNNRLGATSFDAAIFTNLSHEHLEFHGSFEQYRDDKINLFRRLKPDGFGIVNLDDSNAPYFIEAVSNRVYSCSLKDPSADFFADCISSDSLGSEFTIHIRKSLSDEKPTSVETRINLPGLFNIENALEAYAAVLLLTGEDAVKLAGCLPGLAAVTGRMRKISCGQPFRVIIDYAHTPGSFIRLFPDLRKLTKGRLIAVFGSAGERDVEKRPEQGRIAGKYADIIVLTDEDPRGEAPFTILEEIASGAVSAARTAMPALLKGNNLFLIPDRRAAFRKAFSLAKPNDTVVLLGKGHEGSIIFSDGPKPWDEEVEAVKALEPYI